MEYKHICIAWVEGDGIWRLTDEELKDVKVQQEAQMLLGGFAEQPLRKYEVAPDHFRVPFNTLVRVK